MALGSGTFSQAGAAITDIFAGDALRTQAAGNRIQAQEYDLASTLSLQNAQYTETSTAIKEQQQQRGLETVLGQQKAGVAASGFTAGGSALDLLRDSASQGALAKETLGQQGLIDEAGYKEQAQSYQLMSQSATMAANAQDQAASNSGITALIHGASAVASIVSGGSIPNFGAMFGPDTDGGSPGGLPEDQ